MGKKKSKKPLAVLNNVLWVPTDYVTDEHRDAFTHIIPYTEYVQERNKPRQCRNCDLWGKRWRNNGQHTCKDKGYSLDDVCRQFSYKEVKVEQEIEIQTYAKVNDDWTKFARGDLGKIKSLFGSDFRFRDERSAPELGFDLECTKTLYPEQQEVVNSWLKHKYGIIQAPTAFGKTVMWAWLVAHLKVKTLLLAHEVRHLRVGFEGIYDHTNLSEIEEAMGGVHLAGVMGKDWYWATDQKGNKTRKFKAKKGATYPIMFTTFQALASEKGKKIRQELKDEYGFVHCEEAHHESAETFNAATRSFNPKYRSGQTATPTRKDMTHVVIYDTLGPVTARGFKEAMTPEVYFYDTQIYVPASVFRGKYGYTKLVSWLASNKAYTDFVYEKISEEIEEGRKPLLISERKNHVARMAQRLSQDGYSYELIVGGKEMGDQTVLSQRLMSGELQCIIGTKVMNENVNIPPLDSIHLPFPNFGKEVEEQRVGRIRRYLSKSHYRWMEENGVDWDKPDPRVHVYHWQTDNDFSMKALRFRKSLYKSWEFVFQTNPEEILDHKVRETLGSLLDDEELDLDDDD